MNPPPALAAGSQRMSIVYFHYPAADTEVVPAPSCTRGVAIDRAPLHTYDHMMHRQP